MNRNELLCVSVPDAAARLGVGRSLAWALVRRGDLPVARIGGRTLVRLADLDAFLALRVREGA